MIIMYDNNKITGHRIPLQDRYAELMDDYASAFYLKYFGDDIHSVPDYYYAGDIILCIGDYFFNYSDVRYCVDNDVKEQDLFDWYDYCLNIGMIDQYIKTPTLKNWIAGDRGVEKSKLTELIGLKKSVEKAQEELEKALDEYKNTEHKQ